MIRTGDIRRASLLDAERLTVPPGRAALVASGTSRFLVTDGEPVYARYGHGLASEELEAHLCELVLGGCCLSPEESCHYQHTKLVLVTPRVDGFGRGYDFRFFQYVPSTGRIVGDLECANGAAASALFAIMAGYVTPDGHGVEAYNVGTGQRVLLMSDGFEPFEGGEVDVRFDARSPAIGIYSGSVPLVLEHGSARVNFWALERGNLFVLANLEPSLCSEDLLEALVDAGETVHHRLGGRPTGPLTKLLVYDVQARSRGWARVSAACFSRAGYHKSIPGSGAMCLASFLASAELAESEPEGERGFFRVDIEHPSGLLPVRVGWRRTPKSYVIEFAEFTTFVGLLSATKATP